MCLWRWLLYVEHEKRTTQKLVIRFLYQFQISLVTFLANKFMVVFDSVKDLQYTNNKNLLTISLN